MLLMATLTDVNRVRRCTVCCEPLKMFVAYLPSAGEVCMGCYVKAARESEKSAVMR